MSCFYSMSEKEKKNGTEITFEVDVSSWNAHVLAGLLRFPIEKSRYCIFSKKQCFWSNVKQEHGCTVAYGLICFTQSIII